MLNQDQIQGKWTEIKGGVRNLWGKITDDELEATKGNLTAISGIVQQKYGEAKESISKKMDSLMDSFDNETDKSLKLNDGESSYQRNPTGVRTSETSKVQDDVSDVKTRSPERSAFEKSEGGDINAKQGIAGNRDVKSSDASYGAGLSAGTGVTGGKDSTLHDVDLAGEDEFDTEEIFDEGDKEDQTFEAKNQGLDKSRFNSAKDRIARH